jgi:hypothetical protein
MGHVFWGGEGGGLIIFGMAWVNILGLYTGQGVILVHTVNKFSLTSFPWEGMGGPDPRFRTNFVILSKLRRNWEGGGGCNFLILSYMT